jgi:hypothetical protein
MLTGVDVRIVLACALLGAILAGALAVAGGTDYRARSFVIRVPPDFSGERGLALARGDAVLGRALELAGEDERDAGWLRERSTSELTSRQDLSFTVEAPERDQSAALATAYAKAYREQIPQRAGLTTRGRGARDAQLHKSRSYIAVVDEQGRKVISRRIDNDPATFLELLKNVDGESKIAVEATSGWEWLAVD